jgi:hypothetical protein
MANCRMFVPRRPDPSGAARATGRAEESPRSTSFRVPRGGPQRNRCRARDRGKRLHAGTRARRLDEYARGVAHLRLQRIPIPPLELRHPAGAGWRNALQTQRASRRAHLSYWNLAEVRGIAEARGRPFHAAGSTSGQSPSVVPIQASRAPRRAGRRPGSIDTDWARDRWIAQAWQGGHYRSKLELARDLGIASADLSAAIDRDRKRP